MNLNPFIDIIIQVLGLYGWVLIAWIIVSLLITFEVVNRHNPFVAKFSDVLYKLTEPVLRRIRRYMPNLGVIDISPIIVFLLINFISSALRTYLYTY